MKSEKVVELTNELKSYLREHKEGVVLKDVPDVLLIEMTIRFKSFGNDKEREWQEFFNLDKFATCQEARDELYSRGYHPNSFEQAWGKDGIFYNEDGCQVTEYVIPDKFLMESVYYGINKEYASRELAKRGYSKICAYNGVAEYQYGWVKNEERYSMDGEKIEIVPFTMDSMLNILGAEERTPQRMYVRAYPETIDLLKDLCKDYAHGLKGKMEAKILDEALKAYENNYKCPDTKMLEFQKWQNDLDKISKEKNVSWEEIESISKKLVDIIEGEDSFELKEDVETFVKICLSITINSPADYGKGSSVAFSEIPEITGGLSYCCNIRHFSTFLKMMKTEWKPGCDIKLNRTVNLKENDSEMDALMKNLDAYESSRTTKIVPCILEWNTFRKKLKDEKLLEQLENFVSKVLKKS